MLCLIIIIIIDFYNSICLFKKNIGTKEKTLRIRIITIKPNNWKKTHTPVRKCIKSLQTCKTERYVTTMDEALVCTVAE